MIYNKKDNKEVKKMKNIVYPDYNNSIMNTISTILTHYGIESNYSTIEDLSNSLNKPHQNVVLMVFDGMGIDMLNQNLKADDFINQNIIKELTSVFPSTTTAAMTAYYSGKSPNEHGWLGWSLYFKEYGRFIDTFINTDSYSGEKIDAPHAGHTCMPYEHILDKIEQTTNQRIKTYMIEPAYIAYQGKNTKIGVESAKEVFTELKKLCDAPHDKFIFVYWPDPDKTMHSTGCYSNETKEKIKEINDLFKQIVETTSNTLFIASADHGLIDVEPTIYLNEYEELDECFIMPPSIEKRAVSFFIKPEMKQAFEERFNRLFGEEFILLSKQEVLNQQLFGQGLSHRKTTDFLGDYLACATGKKVLGYLAMTTKRFDFGATHAGLTKEEMMVPLIIIES
ncbi:phosphodiesterase [Turicibacter sanguinis]|jgi:type I phosphodiesterase/nucleotide pyrophosphatase|uniref:Phosphodiesterase n=3 Tax=Turicibacteraceae TaxID=2810281 RepID=A0A6A8SD66_9FIRM|nr:type I phosphodiesterase/nucleotide pyrophosphatase [Turicibacter sanguinis PC909]EGC91285.1 type I phosphodiesterase/nucleotide pyrophosphatase [Turicibacter sp. HGF1]MBP3902832.1 alkaline phosphatase family protein [Turicibacter sp.]MTH05740.1 phosphodiesterase [Turicibacter sanguinis]MTH08755.1 phosphodiesterase [Turicibacter sanguinis]